MVPSEASEGRTVPDLCPPWLADGHLLCVFTRSSFVCICVQISSSCKDTSYIQPGPTRPHFNLITSLKPVSKYGHLLRLGIYHMNLLGDTIQPTTLFYLTGSFPTLKCRCSCGSCICLFLFMLSLVPLFEQSFFLCALS